MSRIEQIREMLKDDPADAFLLYALALEYERAGDADKAIEELLSLQKKQSSYLPVYYKLGKLFEQKSQITEAIAAYKNGITVARQQNDNKTLAELKEALFQWEDED